MTNSTRRYAAAVTAAFAPLAVVSVMTAAPSSAECAAGQSSFGGNCVDSNCKKSEVRDSNTGECRSALSAALGKAQTQQVNQVSPEQWGKAYEWGTQNAGLPSGVNATKDVFNVVNSAIDIPTSIASGASDTADALYFAGQFLGGAGGAAASSVQAPLATATSLARVGNPIEAVSNVADFAKALPSPGVPKIGMPEIGMPKVGLPKVGLPKIGMPKLFQACLPVKFVFFRPCI